MATADSGRQENLAQVVMDHLQQMEDRLEERITRLQSIQVEQSSQLSRLLTAKAQTREKQVIDDSFKDDEDGEPSIPVEHTTAAHKLLTWPSIRALLYPKEYDENYVMKIEGARGLIRVYGRGEGNDMSTFTRQGQTPMSYMSSHSTPSWDKDYIPAGSLSDGFRASSATPVTSTTSIKTVEHGIDESGVFTANPDTVRRLYLSYMEHLHTLHPFLDQDDLEKRIEVFISTYCSFVKPSNQFTSFVNNHNDRDHLRRVKRKRSCVMPSPSSPPCVEQSIDNAVVLLVLALGSICECRCRPVPGPVTDKPQDHGQVVPSRNDADTWNLRNMDIIPGLAYYGYATQILGGLLGANGLPHAQAALLAALYAGQLAHPFQSHGWVYQAARACQVLVQSYILPSGLVM